jgi:hypothetical protein
MRGRELKTGLRTGPGPPVFFAIVVRIFPIFSAYSRAEPVWDFRPFPYIQPQGSPCRSGPAGFCPDSASHTRFDLSPVFFYRIYGDYEAY